MRCLRQDSLVIRPERDGKFMEMLNRLMIHRFAFESGLDHVVDEIGDVHMTFAAPEPIYRSDRGLLVRLGCCDGCAIEAQGQFDVRGMSSAEVLERCNRWNRGLVSSRHAWLSVAREDTAHIGGWEVIHAQIVYPAATGTSQETVIRVCELILSSMHEAWNWFRQESIDKQFAVLARQLTEPVLVEGAFARLRRRFGVRPGVLAHRAVRYRSRRGSHGHGRP